MSSLRSLGFPLLGLALCACGDEGDATSNHRSESRDAGAPWFEETASASGIAFRYESGHREEHYMPEIMGGGAALFDLEGDGDLDAYLVQGGRIAADDEAQPTNRLYRNDGEGMFLDVTANSGADDTRYGMGVACADVDDDGRTDLYVTNVGRNTLLANAGDGRFDDTTERSGAGHTGWGASAAFFDLDRDGDLDLYVTNYLDWSVQTELPCLDPLGRPDYCSPKNYKTPARDAVFLNGGVGVFSDHSAASGVSAEPGTGLGVACGDFDGDGNADVFVANDGMPDHLWMNRGDGTFANEAQAWCCATDANGLNKAGMGVTLADVDGDIDLDLLVCNLAGETDSVFLNEGAYFVDRTARMGLAATSKPFTRFGMGWVDFDLDGELDLFQANGRVQRAGHDVAGDPYAEENLLFRGLGDLRFEEITPRGGTRESLVATSRAAAFGDVNGDGAVDVLVVNRDGDAHLLRNRIGAATPDTHWILFRVCERSGRDAIGAVLELAVGARKVRRDVRAAYSYLASNDPRVHLGLGAATRVDRVVVRWVDGSAESFGPFEADRVHTLARGDGAPVQ